jgi:hypothetical protein
LAPALVDPRVRVFPTISDAMCKTERDSMHGEERCALSRIPDLYIISALPPLSNGPTLAFPSSLAAASLSGDRSGRRLKQGDQAVHLT